MEVWSAALTLFLIMDPLGNLPVFMSILKTVPEERRNKVLIRELLIALFIMLLFLYAGQSILSTMGLAPEAVSISGGIILFIIAIRMIFPPANGPKDDELQHEPFIVPLATPLVAGPSLLASLMLLVNRHPEMLTEWTFAALGAWLASAVILMFCKPLYKVIGERGLMALERLMGMILVMLAVQMLLDGAVAIIH